MLEYMNDRRKEVVAEFKEEYKVDIDKAYNRTEFSEDDYENLEMIKDYLLNAFTLADEMGEDELIFNLAAFIYDEVVPTLEKE